MRALLEQALELLIERGAQPGYKTERHWLKVTQAIEAELAKPVPSHNGTHIGAVIPAGQGYTDVALYEDLEVGTLLYKHPPAPPQPERQPMPYEQLHRLWTETLSEEGLRDFLEGFRAAERHHGIVSKP